MFQRQTCAFFALISLLRRHPCSRSKISIIPITRRDLRPHRRAAWHRNARRHAEMGTMQMMMGQGGMDHFAMMATGMSEHVEGRLAFLKTELKITDAQLPLWNSFAKPSATTRRRWEA